MNEVLKAILERRSVRKFTGGPIAREEMETLLQAASYAPSGMGKQSWQFTAVTDGAKIAALCEAMGKAMGKEGYDMYRPAALILASNDRENGNGLADCACALQNIFLAAHSLGLGSVWINQLKETSDEPGVRAVLNGFGVPAEHIVWGVASLGHPAETPAAKPRREGVIHWAD
ncbi:nitroreductase family protein [bacterium 210820-DFI.6.52]|nr:nitroreductase family protein [bacterium 210820-DFI.6.52]